MQLKKKLNLKQNVFLLHHYLLTMYKSQVSASHKLLNVDHHLDMSFARL